MIKDKVVKILSEIPVSVQVVAAAKTRNAREISEAIDAGVKIIGENYVQEAKEAFGIIGRKVKWHFIGHLQKNKVKKVVEIFDLIETVDTYSLAEQINKHCAKTGKIMPLLIEINSTGEEQKFGVLAKDALELIREISILENLKIYGLMTMGPNTDNIEILRNCFAEIKNLFETIKAQKLPSVEMRMLSMGMSGSYKIAIEQGANVVRLGTVIFGQRNCSVDNREKL
ncbi:MAG: YggS family pyridoxal phosphate-dependent enzyme [Candidatus Omnitrophota bacterium]|nr:MAG: YggS family pyridoxal phosphate-dependent enzyme [Candidatus Omnitrophota bacterium]